MLFQIGMHREFDDEPYRVGTQVAVSAGSPIENAFVLLRERATQTKEAFRVASIIHNIEILIILGGCLRPKSFTFQKFRNRPVLETIKHGFGRA